MTTRRDFLKTTAVTAGALALAGNVHAAGSDMIKVGLIGLGGRGSGAASDVLHSAKGVSIVAIGDVFEDKVKSSRNDLTNGLANEEKVKALGNTVDLPADRCYSGLDAYEKVINTSEVNYIILATPPGFRPTHIQAAVAAGKNFFTEKPVAVDAAGIRKVLQAYDDAQKKGLHIAAGTQRRHEAGYLDTVKQLHDGAIGDIVAGRCYWNGGKIWFRSRKQGMSDVEYQIHNWYHFLWTCGDHITEQHVHNLDVINWILKSPPVACVGMGGRVRPCKDPNVDGQIYNFFSIEYEYPNGVRVLSTCRQIDGCDHNISEAVVGTKGSCQVNAHTINGKKVTEAKSKPYVQEHTDLIASIRDDKPLNELKNVAESTMTAIMGRQSAYTGLPLKWADAIKAPQDTMPQKLTLDMSLAVGPVPVPGKPF